MTTLRVTTENDVRTSLQNCKPLRAPVKANIEVVRACNIRCPACPVGSGLAHKYPMMKSDIFKKIIDVLSGSVKKLALFNYGEPLLHPQIAEFVQYSKRAGICEVLIHSNGLLLTRSLASKLINAHLDQITISIDGVGQKTYARYRRGGNFTLLIENLRGIIALKKKNSKSFPRIVGQFIVMDHNEHQLQKFRDLMEELGLDDITFKTFNANMELGKGNDHSNMIPNNIELSRYNQSIQAFGQKVDPRRSCTWPRKQLVVNVDGTIVPCCYDYNNIMPLGHVFSMNDNKWWMNKLRVQFIRDLEVAPDTLEPCRQCPMGMVKININGLGEH